MGLRHLHQGIILLVEENLDPLDISIHSCRVHHQKKRIDYLQEERKRLHLQLTYVVTVVGSVRR